MIARGRVYLSPEQARDLAEHDRIMENIRRDREKAQPGAPQRGATPPAAPRLAPAPRPAPAAPGVREFREKLARHARDAEHDRVVKRLRELR
jgi:hypothetical protein